jgi:hypothetical protein
MEETVWQAAVEPARERWLDLLGLEKWKPNFHMRLTR